MWDAELTGPSYTTPNIIAEITAVAWWESEKPFWEEKNPPQYTKLWSNSDLPVFDSLVYCDSSALDDVFSEVVKQALEVLRKTPSSVVLTVCRPPSDVFSDPPPSEPPPPPRRDPAHSITGRTAILPLPPLQTEGPTGEFDIHLTKVNHSLGFTLRKEDESVLGHYVRALVREPALSDGRIRPGDKIVAVNDVDISPMSHEEAVMFLRQCGDHVKLRLYRDAAQTPVSALSPTEESKLFRPKPILRKEAMDMLCDLAVRKLSPGDNSTGSSSYTRLRRVSDGQSSSSPSSSPRRRKLTKTPSPDAQPLTQERIAQKYLVSSHVGNSDSSGEGSNTNTCTYQSSFDSTAARGRGSSFASSEEGGGPELRPQRPNFLDLCGASSLPGTARKQRFTFSTDGEEEGSLCHTGSDEPDTLGSVSRLCPSDDEAADRCDLPLEPTSMPPLTNLSSTSSTSTAFSYRNPAYQSACPAMRGKVVEEVHEHASDQDIPGKVFGSCPGGAEGTRGLLKWKGVVFTPESDPAEEDVIDEGETIKSTGECLKQKQREGQVFMVELTRGWNSRLGFSLQSDGNDTYISAIYADSVAAKDGRLRAGDQVIMVNDEDITNMTTSDLIDLLRKIRGTIGITVLRKTGPRPQASPDDGVIAETSSLSELRICQAQQGVYPRHEDLLEASSKLLLRHSNGQRDEREEMSVRVIFVITGQQRKPHFSQLPLMGGVGSSFQGPPQGGTLPELPDEEHSSGRGGKPLVLPELGQSPQGQTHEIPAQIQRYPHYLVTVTLE
uniref:PDZ domain-containing protein n=1 Tax=Timema cristinae TaxID=61476 RepID=A0A7R9CTI8_TIMCR|nr:unnamed protein product [Timema cristinae]